MTISKDWLKHLSKAGKLGGKVSNARKSKAARENGKKGGRPKKVLEVQKAKADNSILQKLSE